MARNPTAAAKQAKKKHDKDVGRRGAEAASKTRDGSIHAYAAGVDVPFFRAAFELSFPLVGASRENLSTWSLRRVAGLETNAILEELRRMGIEAGWEDFRRDTTMYRSAVAYARDAWLTRLSGAPKEATSDFVCLAAHELWKRWNGERPSREMAVEALLHLRNCYQQENGAGVAKWGLKFWAGVAPELTNDVRTLDALDAKLDAGRGVFLRNHLGEFADLAPWVAARDRELGQQVVDVLEAMTHQFSDESDDWRYQNVEDTARVLHEVGQEKRAETMLRDLIAVHPRKAGAYLALADLWSSNGDEESSRRALALLEQAEALPVEDGRAYELDERIEELFQDLEQTHIEPLPHYTNQSTQRLVRMLKIAFDDVPDEHIEEIGRRGNEAIAPLIHILADDYFWDPTVPDEGAALRNAFRAIGAIGTFEAGRALMDKVIEHREEDELPEEAFYAMRQLTPRGASKSMN